jgi:peptidoglycan/LPS O-acetylase OafA/YrhL
VLLASIAWALSFWNMELFTLTTFICVPYIVLGIAFKSIPYVNTIGKKADISYGLYIFHYPVQQTLINYFNLDPLTLLTATLLITVPLAWLSWRLIESRALGLKDIDIRKAIPGRRLRTEKVEIKIP